MTSNYNWKAITAFISVLTIGTIISFFLYSNSLKLGQKIAQNQFGEESLKLVSGVQERVKRAQSLLYGTRGLFEASNSVTLEEWERFVWSLDLPLLFPNVRFLCFVSVVPRAEKGAFVKTMNDYGAHEFKIWPAEDSPISFPVTYFSSQNFVSFLGYDLGTTQKYREFLEKPTKLHETTYSNDFTLKDSRINKTSFAFWLPVSKQKQSFQSTASVLASGWIALSIDLASILETEAASQKLSQINLQLFNKDQLNSENLIYSRMMAPNPNPLFSEQKSIQFGEKEWTLLLTSGPNFQTRINKSFPNTVFCLSELFSILLAIAVYYAFALAQKVEIKVNVINQELKDAYSYYQQLLNNIRYGIIAVDAQGTIRTFNRAAEKLLGYSADEVIGKKTPLEFHDPLEMQAYAKELSELFGKPFSPGMGVFFAKAQEGVVDERKWTYIKKDQTKVEVLLNLTALKDEKDHIIGYIGVAIPTQK